MKNHFRCCWAGVFSIIIMGQAAQEGDILPRQASQPSAASATADHQWYLDYSTYLGGDGSGEGQYGYAVIADSMNNMIVAGFARSPGFPITHRFGIEEVNSGAFITKLDPTGRQVLFSAFFPGGTVQSLALDSQDNIYFTGDGADYFITTNAFQAVSNNGGNKPFAAKLSADGANLIYSTFLGGSGMDMARGIAVDGQGEAWVTGWTSSTNFPVTGNALQPVFGGQYDAFLAKISASGTTLLYSTYLGGDQAEASSSVALDNQGNVYLGGWSRSQKFANNRTPQLLGPGGWQNGFVVKLSASGTNLEYLTFVGGTDRQSLVAAVAVDALGQAYLFGDTDATNFPVSLNCWQPENRGGFDNFLVKLNQQGSAIVYATYLGGTDDDYASQVEYIGEDRIALGKSGLAVDSSGNAYVAGRTSSWSFAPPGIAANVFSDYYDGYVAKVNADGSALEHLLYLGNSHWDGAFALALDRLGRVLVAGSISPGPIPPFFPTTSGALVVKDGGNNFDVFLTRLREEEGPPANDAFSNRITLPGPRTTVFGNNSGAGKEAGEPTHAGNAGGKSLWWSWQAPANGRLTVATAGSSFDTLLAVYTNTTLSALKLVAANDDAANNDTTSQVKLAVLSGTEYQIAVDGHDGESGTVILTLTLSEPPNDDFADRITITNFPVTVTGSNVDASYEPGDPNEGRDVWWQWIAPISGSVAISTAGSTYDSDIVVFTNSTLAELGLVGVNGANKQINIQAVAGTAYQISVGGGYDLASGTITLKIMPGAPPANDNFTNSIVMTGVLTNFTANNYGASREPGEPELSGPEFHYGPGYHTVWWSWQAPDDGRVTITATSADFDVRMGAYAGSQLTNLLLITSNEDQAVPHANPNTSQMNFAVRSNTVYHIMVDGVVDKSEGQFQVALHYYHSFSIISQLLTRPTVAGFPIQGQGYPGTVYGVEASTNLLDWEAVSSENFTGPSFNWVDTNAWNYPRRYYRWVEKRP